MNIRMRSAGTAMLLATTLTLSMIQGVLAATSTDSTPLGRTASPIVDGQYPASYFPNTELLGPKEMRITALGTGMPNQTK